MQRPGVLSSGKSSLEIKLHGNAIVEPGGNNSSHIPSPFHGIAGTKT
jgi:hypothetical protein